MTVIIIIAIARLYLYYRDPYTTGAPVHRVFRAVRRLIFPSRHYAPQYETEHDEQ